jgi:hypothetical protein
MGSVCGFGAAFDLFVGEIGELLVGFANEFAAQPGLGTFDVGFAALSPPQRVLAATRALRLRCSG